MIRRSVPSALSRNHAFRLTHRAAGNGAAWGRGKSNAKDPRVWFLAKANLFPSVKTSLAVSNRPESVCQSLPSYVDIQNGGHMRDKLATKHVEMLRSAAKPGLFLPTVGKRALH
jgi:hypothetical protein